MRSNWATCLRACVYALDDELVRDEHLDGFVSALKGDQAFELSAGELTLIKTKDSGLHLAPGAWLIGRDLVNHRKSEYLDLVHFFYINAGKGAPFCQFYQAIKSKQEQSWASAMIFPGIAMCYQGGVRLNAELRCLRVLIALQNHVPAGTSDVPRLADLGLPAERTTDPYNGEPLHVKKTPRGWLVYCVGLNGKDDDGKVDDPMHGDVGIGPPTRVAKPAESGRDAKSR